MTNCYAKRTANKLRSFIIQSQALSVNYILRFHATSQQWWQYKHWYLIKLSFITAWISFCDWCNSVPMKNFLCVCRASSKARGPSQDWSLLRPPQWAWEDEGEGHRSHSSPPANSQYSGKLLQPTGTDTDNRWAPQHQLLPYTQEGLGLSTITVSIHPPEAQLSKVILAYFSVLDLDLWPLGLHG